MQGHPSVVIIPFEKDTSPSHDQNYRLLSLGYPLVLIDKLARFGNELAFIVNQIHAQDEQL